MNADHLGLYRQGEAARRAGKGFHDNPVYFASADPATPEQLLDWHEGCLAWSAGWTEEDAGRDPALRQLIKVRSW